MIILGYLLDISQDFSEKIYIFLHRKQLFFKCADQKIAIKTFTIFFKANIMKKCINVL